MKKKITDNSTDGNLIPPVIKPVTLASELRTKKLKAWQLNSKLSPVARGREKESKVLLWIYQWGYSSAGMIDKLAGSHGNGYARKLEKKKLVQGLRTESGGGRKGVPNFIFTLTQTGVEEVEKDVEKLISYEIDIARINQANLRHDELTQRSTFNALYVSKTITEFSTPKEKYEADKLGVKDFDAIWTKNDRNKLGIEVELSGKWARKLDQFIDSIRTALAKNIVQEVMIVTNSRAIHTRYSEQFKTGNSYSSWVKDAQGRWEMKKEKKQVNEEFSKKVICVLLSD